MATGFPIFVFVTMLHRRHLLLLPLLTSMVASAQFINGGFEQYTNAWNFTCPAVTGFSTDAPPYGGAVSLSIGMLSSTQPDCYFTDGIEPFVYQEMPGLQNGMQISVSYWAKAIPDLPANAPYMTSTVGFGWMSSPTTFETATVPGCGLWGGTGVGTEWALFFETCTITGLPLGVTPVIRFGGHAFSNTNGTLLLDNVQLIVSGTGATLSAKAWLDGCYVQAQNLMRDDLRSAGLVPTTNPYGGPETTTPAVLAVTGSNAIVDWVRLELRTNPSIGSTIRRNALLQRDGDIVDVDGVSPVTFPVASGNFFVMLGHRNHLSVMSAAPVALTAATTVMDFRSAATNCLVRPAPDTDLPRKTVGTARVLWAGELTGDHRIKYTGAGNDRDNVLASCCGAVPTATLAGYYLPTDVNMDGVVKYIGANNDRDPILVNIGGSVPTNVRVEQVP